MLHKSQKCVIDHKAYIILFRSNKVPLKTLAFFTYSIWICDGSVTFGQNILWLWVTYALSCFKKGSVPMQISLCVKLRRLVAAECVCGTPFSSFYYVCVNRYLLIQIVAAPSLCNIGIKLGSRRFHYIFHRINEY